MSNFKIYFLVNLLLVLPLMSDPRAPDGQCYIVLPVNDEDAAIEELDINPQSLEVYESDDASTTYVTLGKTYIELFDTNKNIFPSGTRCSKGNNLGSFWLWLIKDPGTSDSYLMDSYILGEKPIGWYGFDRIAIKRFTTKDIDFLFSSNVMQLKKLIEPYSTFINQKGIEFRKAEEARIAKENAASEAKKIALARAKEEEANKKAAAETAALKAIADAEEAKQLQKEKRRAWWFNLFKWIGIILLGFLALGQYQRKKEATKAGFSTIKAYDQHLIEKREEEERLQKLEEEKLLEKAIEIARNAYQVGNEQKATDKIGDLVKKYLKDKNGTEPSNEEHLELCTKIILDKKVSDAFLHSNEALLKEESKKEKERIKKAAKKAGFSSVAEYENHLREKSAKKAGFNSVEEHENYLEAERRANAAESRAREAESKARQAEAKARQAEAKANQKSSDGSLLKTAAGVAVTAAAVKAVQRPPRVVFNDPSYKVGEIKRAGLLPMSGWKVRWYKVDGRGKEIKNGQKTITKPGVFKNKAKISNPCKGYIYWD